MIAKEGDFVEINGGFVFLSPEKGCGDPDNFIVIHIWENDDNTRKREFKDFKKLIDSNGTTKIKVAKTLFLVSHVQGHKNEVLTERKEKKKMLVVFNKHTREAFLIMKETQSLRSANKFLDTHNSLNQRIIGDYDHHFLRTTNTYPNLEFNVTHQSGLMFIKLV